MALPYLAVLPCWSALLNNLILVKNLLTDAGQESVSRAS